MTINVRNFLIPSHFSATDQLVSFPFNNPSSPPDACLFSPRDFSTFCLSRAIPLRRYASPPHPIHNAVQVQVIDIHQIRTAWTHNHLEPEEDTSPSIPARSIEVLIMLSGA
jgi:hypothetical protein